MRRQLQLSFFAVFLILSRSAMAAHPNCPTVTPAAGFPDFTVDLSTGGPVGKPSYKLSDRVRLVFINRNPFLQYDIKLESTELEEPALTAFVNLFPDLVALTQTKAAVQAETQANLANIQGLEQSRIQTNRDKNECWAAIGSASRMLGDATATLDRLNGSATALESSFTTLKDVFSKGQAIFERKSTTCDLLQSTGSRLQTAVNNANPSSALRAYQSTYDSLFAADASGLTAIEKIDRALLEAESKCTNDPEARITIVLLAQLKARTFDRGKIQELAKQKQLFETTVRDILAKAAEIQAILADPSNFILYRYAGPFEAPSEVKVSVRVKKASEAQFQKDPDFTFALNFGGPRRFNLGVGIAASRLPTPEYEAIQNTSLTTTGNSTTTTVTRVVGLKDNSEQRITPMLVLNTRLSNSFGIVSGIHLSFGLSGKVDNRGTDVEYLAGLSLGLAENRVFLTLGGYNGRVQKLQPGFSLGSELPKEITQPPVRKDRSWKPMIAISYRVR